MNTVPIDPRTKERRRHNLWEIVSYLWVKYIGVSEEYELLKEKWAFLQDAHPPAISVGKGSQVFIELDKSISRTEKMFKKFGLAKKSQDAYKNFRERDWNLCNKIRRELFSLVNYVGLLKLAYFQRTVSYEVMTSTGFAYGPEKTIGSEIVYVAADKVTKTYADCIEIKRRRPGNEPVFVWDNFITFVPPIQARGFFGALCTPYAVGLYHVSLSEEQKSQITPFMMLAHEISHVAAMDPDNEITSARDEYESFLAYIVLHTKNILNDLFDDGILQRWERCQNCPLNALGWISLQEVANDVIKEVFADWITFKVAGPNIVELILDEAFSTPLAKLRVNCLSKYMREQASGTTEIARSNEIDLRVDDVNRRERISVRRERSRKHLPLTEPFVDICPGCLAVTGQTIGRCLKSFEDRHPRKAQSFIKKGKLFSISKREEDSIISSLLEGIPQTSVDPRKILHCYFEAFKGAERIGRKPQYLVTLYSLAFSET